LAWTSVGGDILFIESLLSPERNYDITGNLGTVMKESATIALEYIKANAKLLGLDSRFFLNTTFTCTFQKALHQDGPSAGTMLTSLVSLFTQNG
jgi:ATP-dependent Lon protease